MSYKIWLHEIVLWPPNRDLTTLKKLSNLASRLGRPISTTALPKMSSKNRGSALNAAQFFKNQIALPDTARLSLTMHPQIALSTLPLQSRIKRIS